MTGRRLVLLRHGRTAWNHAGRVQGQLDVELDDEGLAQATRCAPVLAALGPTVLWSSDLARAARTADAVAEATGLTPRRDPRLRECRLGERQGLTHDEYRARAPEEFERFRQGWYDDVPGAEQTPEVRARMGGALRELLGALEPGETGVAVSHGAAIRIATGEMLGWPADTFRTLRGLGNCGWVVLEEQTSGRLVLSAYNRSATAT